MLKKMMPMLVVVSRMLSLTTSPVTRSVDIDRNLYDKTIIDNDLLALQELSEAWGLYDIRASRKIWVNVYTQTMQELMDDMEYAKTVLSVSGYPDTAWKQRVRDNQAVLLDKYMTRYIPVDNISHPASYLPMQFMADYLNLTQEIMYLLYEEPANNQSKQNYYLRVFAPVLLDIQSINGCLIKHLSVQADHNH